MTYDRYGHLFPRGDDAKELDAAEEGPFGVNATQARHIGEKPN